MPSRPDLRELAANVKEAFAEMDRDALLDILTFVVKEYVVEGPPPMLIHQAETLADLKNISFAQLIAALQTRFDFPELAMFVVDGDQVSVRLGGVVHPLIAQRTPAPGMQMPPAQMIDTRPQPQPPQPGVRVVETAVQQRPATPTQPAAAAPPPARGLSVRGRPSGEGEAPPPARPAQPAPQQGAPQQPPPAQGQPAQGQAQPGAPQEKPEGSGDDASARFSLLELD
jgi:hypothetical protein